MKSSVYGYSVYKPTKSNTGAALQFNPANDCSFVFLEIASQDDKQSFDWENKIVFKLSINDMVLITDCLNIVRTSKFKDLLRAAPADYDQWMLNEMPNEKGVLLSIFHADKKNGSTSSLTLKPNSSKYGGGFLLGIYKKFEDGGFNNHKINISPHEALGILYTLEKCIFRR